MAHNGLALIRQERFENDEIRRLAVDFFYIPLSTSSDLMSPKAGI